MKKIILFLLIAINCNSQNAIKALQDSILKVEHQISTAVRSAIPSGTNSIGSVSVSGVPTVSVNNFPTSYSIAGTPTIVTNGNYLQQTVFTAVTASANITSSAFGSANYTSVGFQFVVSGIDAADGVIKIMDSIDGTNYNDISGATITVASGSNSNMIRYTAFTGNYIKAVWTKGSNTTGTFTGTILFK